MQWWCAAQGVPWTWAWQPYPGVWLFIAALCALFLRARDRSAPEGSPERGSAGWWAVGVVTLWIALDWPVGALGAGYLASVHMVQFVLIALIAPPFLLLGFPARAAGRAADRPPDLAGRFLAHPVTAQLGFLVIIVATHWPAAVDFLMATQLGSMVLDLAWLGGGLLFWRPVLRPGGGRAPLHPAGKVGYLILGTIVLTGPYIFLTFAQLPFYATYELAPPVGDISSREDQRVAGVIMRVGGGIVLWISIGVLFLKWYQAENPVTARSG